MSAPPAAAPETPPVAVASSASLPSAAYANIKPRSLWNSLNPFSTSAAPAAPVVSNINRPKTWMNRLNPFSSKGGSRRKKYKLSRKAKKTKKSKRKSSRRSRR